MNEAHIRPLDDEIEHGFQDCPCGPTPELVITESGDAWMYIHHSLDGREGNMIVESLEDR